MSYTLFAFKVFKQRNIECFKTRGINRSTRFVAALHVIKSTDIASEVDFNEFTLNKTMPCYKLLTNLASSNRTEEYWPSVVFVRTSLRSVRTVTTSGQYSSVRLQRSVSKIDVACYGEKSVLDIAGAC